MDVGFAHLLAVLAFRKEETPELRVSKKRQNGNQATRSIYLRHTN